MTDFELPHDPDWSASALQVYANAGLFSRGATIDEVVVHCRARLCYLATPYTKLCTDAQGVWDHDEHIYCGALGSYWTAHLAARGVTAVSPIAVAVTMIEATNPFRLLDPVDAAFWERWCRPLLMASDCVIVPPIPGYAESAGVWSEVRHALTHQKRVMVIRDGVAEPNWGWVS